jgi:hypothetical protein
LQRSHEASHGSEQHTPSMQFPNWQALSAVHAAPMPPRWSMQLDPFCAQRRTLGSPQSLAQQRFCPSTDASQLLLWHSAPP